MAGTRDDETGFARPLRRILLGGLLLCLIGVFLLWRFDGPRVERVRAALIDEVVPSMDWALAPVTRAATLLEELRSYARLHEQNQQLRREIRRMQNYKEAAIQLEQENAKLRKLNQVRLDPQLTTVTGEVMADAGSPFRQSVILNVGEEDGIREGWATTDGLGLVGRVAGVGETTSRVLLLTDSTSRIPVTIQPSGQRALLSGDNHATPPLDFLEDPERVRPGDRVVSSGDGDVFPSDLLVGQVMQGNEGRLRVRLAADYARLEFLRVLRSPRRRRPAGAAGLVAPRRPRAARLAREGGDG